MFWRSSGLYNSEDLQERADKHEARERDHDHVERFEVPLEASYVSLHIPGSLGALSLHRFPVLLLGHFPALASVMIYSVTLYKAVCDSDYIQRFAICQEEILKK